MASNKQQQATILRAARKVVNDIAAEHLVQANELEHTNYAAARAHAQQHVAAINLSRDLTALINLLQGSSS